MRCITTCSCAPRSSITTCGSRTNTYGCYGLTASNDDPDIAVDHRDERRRVRQEPHAGWTRDRVGAGFLAVTAGVWLADTLGASYPLDGYGRLFQASAAFSGIAAAVAGVWLAFLTAARLFRPRSAIWAALAIWLASSSVYYSAISPTYSHAASMLTVGAFWYAWIRTRERQDLPRYALVGFLAGVAALMRWQDAVLLIVPAIDTLWHRQRGLRASLANLAVATGCAILAFSPQLFVWHTLYGHVFVIPQGGGFMRWGTPALWSVLFSDNHGLLSWTPVVALAIAGLVPLTKREPLIGTAAIAFLAISSGTSMPPLRTGGPEKRSARAGSSAAIPCSCSRPPRSSIACTSARCSSAASPQPSRHTRSCS